MAARRLQFTSNARPTSLRTPSKNSLDDAGLYLQQVIGTTSTSSNGIDYLESARSFAFLAGAGAVLATVDDDLKITQRFYRVKPSLSGGKPTTPFYDLPTSSGAPQSPRRTSVFPKREGPAGFPLVGPPAADLLDSPNHRVVNPKERTKAASCVSLSRNGKLLALGEMGHKPRILIFSTARDSATTASPLSSLAEHTFGVRCLAFSPNSLWLASLGDINDGFLYVWAVNSRTGSATLHASNKCTSSVRQIAWMGNSVITVGTRHVKIWRVESNNGDGSDDSGPGSPYAQLQTLPGRNCVLGTLLERTFTTVLAIAEGRAIVCSDQGEVCFLDDTGITPQFRKMVEVGFAIFSAVVYSEEYLVVGGGGGRVVTFDLKSLLTGTPAGTPVIEKDGEGHPGPPNEILGLATMNDLLITLDCRRRFHFLRLSAEGSNGFAVASAKRLPAHGTSVLGVQPLSSDAKVFGAAYLTWSAEGLVLFWDHEGVNVGDMQIALKGADTEDDVLLNELRIVRAIQDQGLIVSGDKHGWLRVHEVASGKTLCETRAHLGEITDLAICKLAEQSLVASAGRDRMVQIFRLREGSVELVQTLDEHAGVVTGVAFTKDGSRLLSFSADRTVVIRDHLSRDMARLEETAFLATRTITLKSTPISACLDADSEDVVLVSTTDRRVQGYQVQSGRLVLEFKTGDLEGGDAVILNSIQHLTTRGYPVIAGVSSGDKSIRLYDDTGRLLAREYGPTEGMTGLAVFTHEAKAIGKGLVTVAADGTIFSWNLSAKSPGGDGSPFTDNDQQTPKGNVLVGRPPLRRILSASEVTRLQGLREDAGFEPSKSRSSRLSPERRSPERQLSRLSLMSTPRLDSAPNLRSPTRDRSPLAEARSRRLTTTARASPGKSDVLVATRAQGSNEIVTAMRGRRRRSVGGGEEGEVLGACVKGLCAQMQSLRSRMGGGLEGLTREETSVLVGELESTRRTAETRVVKGGKRQA